LLASEQTLSANTALSTFYLATVTHCPPYTVINDRQPSFSDESLQESDCTSTDNEPTNTTKTYTKKCRKN